MSIQTCHVIDGRSYIVVKDKELAPTWLINTAVPEAERVKDKEQERVEGY